MFNTVFKKLIPKIAKACDLTNTFLILYDGRALIHIRRLCPLLGFPLIVRKGSAVMNFNYLLLSIIQLLNLFIISRLSSILQLDILVT